MKAASALAHRLPPKVERALRLIQRPKAAYDRDRQLRRLASDRDRLPTLSVLGRLKDAWGGGAVADVGYAAEVCRRARDARAPILECGSGLTTLLLGIYASVPVVSLEESSRWADRMRAALRWYGIPGVSVEYCPIVDYGSFSWYTVPELPSRVSLVVCDGPVAYKKEGAPRYGVVPLLRERFDDRTVILLDDVDRTTERSAIEMWAAEGFSASIVDEGSRAFAVVRLTG